jgi:hypothetical protein
MRRTCGQVITAVSAANSARVTRTKRRDVTVGEIAGLQDCKIAEFETNDC